jgi:transcriptional regulator with XRE-family HTH domain
MIRITGDMLAAGRAMAGLTRQELAARAGVSDRSIGVWERSSAAIPEATYSNLVRAIDALEAVGIRFAIDGSVRRERPATTTTLSEAVAP